MNDKRIHTVRNGQLAGIALDFFDQAVKAQQSGLLNRMMLDCRGGAIDHDTLVGIAHAYTALEDLVSALKREEKNGFKLDKELLANDPPNR